MNPQGAGSRSTRAATQQDCVALLQLAQAFYLEDGFTATEAQLSERLQHLIASSAARVAVSDDGTDLVAFAITTTTYGLESGLSAELEDLYVAPATRRRGLAKELIDDSAHWANSLGVTQLDLVIAPNGLDVQHLHDFYRARGFRDEGRRLIARPLTEDAAL